jgi:hypothetical protein
MSSVFSVLSRVALAGVLCLICGCGNKPSAIQKGTENQPALPAGLERIQGTWYKGKINSYPLCEVIIDEFTIRLRYYKTEETVVKRNARIESIDEKNGVLNIYNMDAPWIYRIDKKQGRKELSLRFYNTDDHQWVYVQLIEATETRPGTQRHNPAGAAKP